MFPFHTWQPDTYEQSPTAVTMVLSGIMVKMGLFGVIRWLLPVLPSASFAYGEIDDRNVGNCRNDLCIIDCMTTG